MPELLAGARLLGQEPAFEADFGRSQEAVIAWQEHRRGHSETASATSKSNSNNDSQTLPCWPLARKVRLGKTSLLAAFERAYVKDDP